MEIESACDWYLGRRPGLGYGT